MMDWSDRHYRYFMRQVSAGAWLYTEMITSGALLHGDVARHLDFSKEEHPVALQLGGSEPADLVKCAVLGEKYGYDEINLNIGCPSERVQRGAFGACLMAEPDLVATCVAEIKKSVDIPVTVKHRTGVDSIEDYEFLRAFVGTIAQAGCKTFIVHARNAILKGLSPKENREVPPLKYAYVYRLKQDFPDLEIVINGGVTTMEEAQVHLQHVDGAMLGRAAYHNPWVLADAGKTRSEIVLKMHAYLKGVKPIRSVLRHLLGLYHGERKARLWRRMLSDAAALARNDPGLLLEALEAAESRSMMAA